MEQREIIKHDLRSQFGTEESARLLTITHVRTGETEVIVEKTITERYPIQEIAKAEDLYERLTCGSGRRLWKLKDIAHPYNPN